MCESDIMPGTYIPFKNPIHIGKLPNIPGSSAVLNFPEELPPDATEVFIYAFATTHDASGEFRRLFFEIFTIGEGDVKYAQFMNIAVGPSIACNSENMWFPVSTKKNMTATLISASGYSSCKCIAYKKKGAKVDDMSEYSDVFLLGYR